MPISLQSVQITKHSTNPNTIEVRSYLPPIHSHKTKFHLHAAKLRQSSALPEIYQQVQHRTPAINHSTPVPIIRTTTRHISPSLAPTISIYIYTALPNPRTINTHPENQSID